MLPEKKRELLKSLIRGAFAGAILPALVLFPKNFAFADNWQAPIYSDSTPGRLVGVDKKKRTFNFFEKKSPLRLRYSYPCVTGQIPGDKMQVNDLRTPEGVYFVEYKIASGLDFKEYGGIAYTLNYPNPVDRLRGKTGHGIWIHSKGFELVPTKGCVAINLRHIAEVGPSLLPGTPVVLAEEISTAAKADNGTLARLRGLMSEWSKAWASRSARLFEFYDPEAYSKATENFDAFRLNKERLFRILTFIKIYNREIHALEGPGYWVTWSEQFYTASNLSTEGVRRLYWQKNDAGDFRIVGMEWIPRDVGMRADFQKGRLVAEGPVTTASDASSEAPLAPRLDMPEQAETPPAQPVESAEKDKPERNEGSKINVALMASISSLAKNLIAISEPLIPKKQPRTEAPDEYSWGEGKTFTDPAEPGHAPREAAPAPLKEPETVKSENAPAERPTPLELTQEDKKRLAEAEKGWREAFENRDAAISGFYDSIDYNRVKGVPQGQSYNAAMRSLEKEMRKPWIMLVAKPSTCESSGLIAHCRAPQMIIDPAGARQGMRDMWWRRGKDGDFKIIASSFTPQNMGMESIYLERIYGDVLNTLEAWRRAWEAGNLDEYMSFYTPDAFQQGKVGQKTIRVQKQGLWSRVKPRSVRLTGMRVLPDGNGARADMTQLYSDTAGRSDKGVKTLHLRYDGKRWLIKREDWANQAAPPPFRLP